MPGGINKAKPTAKSTPNAVQEPTINILQQGGMTPEAALAYDKSAVRKPVSPNVKPSTK